MAQTKATLNQIKTAAAGYVAASKQAGTWVASTNNIAHMLDKIAKSYTIDGDFQDKLPMLDGEELPFGKTLEEYFCDLFLPFNKKTASDLTTDYKPSFENVAYHYTLGEKSIAVSLPYNNIERAVQDATEAGNVTAKVMERLYNSFSMWKYAAKKQLIANAIGRCNAVAGCNKTIAVPVDDTTGEAFIKEIKTAAEDASFANEGNNLGQYLIGAAPNLTLFVKKGTMPSLEVDTLAGAFNQEKLAMPCNIVVVDDFGANPTISGSVVDISKYWAILVDTRGLKMHKTYEAVRGRELADTDEMQYFLHSEFTAVISKSVFIRAYKHS